MKLPTTLAVIAGVLAACSTSMFKEKVWYREGASQDDFYRDQGQCNAQAFSVAGGNMMQIAIVRNACMQGKGWYLRAQD